MSESQIEIDKALEAKLRKLFNLQEGAKEVGNVHEAANAAAKLQDLLLKHNLNMSQVNFKDKNPEPEVGQGGIDIGSRTKKNEGDWVMQLYSVVARANMCHPIIHTKKGKNIYLLIIGTEINCDMTQYMCDQLIPKLRDLCKKYWKLYNGFEKINSFTRAFLRSAALEIGVRLIANVQDAVKSNEGIAGLVRVQDALVKDYVEKTFKLKDVKARSYGANGGAQLGRKAGREVEINKGVGNSSNNKFLG